MTPRPGDAVLKGLIIAFAVVGIASLAGRAAAPSDPRHRVEVYRTVEEVALALSGEPLGEPPPAPSGGARGSAHLAPLLLPLPLPLALALPAREREALLAPAPPPDVGARPPKRAIDSGPVAAQPANPPRRITP